MALTLRIDLMFELQALHTFIGFCNKLEYDFGEAEAYLIVGVEVGPGHAATRKCRIYPLPA